MNLVEQYLKEKEPEQDKIKKRGTRKTK